MPVTHIYSSSTHGCNPHRPTTPSAAAAACFPSAAAAVWASQLRPPQWGSPWGQHRAAQHNTCHCCCCPQQQQRRLHWYGSRHDAADAHAAAASVHAGPCCSAAPGGWWGWWRPLASTAAAAAAALPCCCLQWPPQQQQRYEQCPASAQQPAARLWQLHPRTAVTAHSQHCYCATHNPVSATYLHCTIVCRCSVGS